MFGRLVLKNGEESGKLGYKQIIIAFLTGIVLAIVFVSLGWVTQIDAILIISRINFVVLWALSRVTFGVIWFLLFCLLESAILHEGITLYYQPPYEIYYDTENKELVGETKRTIWSELGCVLTAVAFLFILPEIFLRLASLVF